MFDKIYHPYNYCSRKSDIGKTCFYKVVFMESIKTEEYLEEKYLSDSEKVSIDGSHQDSFVSAEIIVKKNSGYEYSDYGMVFCGSNDSGLRWL